MLKKLVLQFVLSRAAPALIQYGVKLIQNAAVAVSGYFALHGVAVGDNVTMIAAGAAGLVAVGVDFARTKYGDKL